MAAAHFAGCCHPGGSQVWRSPAARRALIPGGVLPWRTSTVELLLAIRRTALSRGRAAAWLERWLAELMAGGCRTGPGGGSVRSCPGARRRHASPWTSRSCARRTDPGWMQRLPSRCPGTRATVVTPTTWTALFGEPVPWRRGRPVLSAERHAHAAASRCAVRSSAGMKGLPREHGKALWSGERRWEHREYRGKCHRLES